MGWDGWDWDIGCVMEVKEWTAYFGERDREERGRKTWSQPSQTFNFHCIA